MIKLLHVTYGYFRFAVLSMLGATVAFALAGLAVTSLRSFFITVLLMIVVGTFVASEIRNNQKVKELLHKQKTEPSVVFTQKDLAHFVTFAEAASLIATFVQPETIPPSAFWLVEWRYDKSKLFVETPAQTTQQYEALILSLASQHLKNQSDMLGKYGIYPIGVSRSSATDLLRSFRRPTDSTKQITGRMVSFTPKTPPPASYIAGFTIAFYYYKLHSDSNPPKPEYLQDILGEPFHIGGGRIIELDPPVQAGA